MATNSKGDNETKSVSMPHELLSGVLQRAKATGMANFSAYVRKLIEDDLAGRKPLVFTEKAADEKEGNKTFLRKQARRVA
jgi:hypothetical protein